MIWGKSDFNWGPRNFSPAKDLTTPFRNFIEVRCDRHVLDLNPSNFFAKKADIKGKK